MFIYSQADVNSINRAVAKARQVKPVARIIGYGHFSVAGSKGERYEVRFKFNNLAELVVSCQCPASAKGKPCYHSAAVAGLYRSQWTAKHHPPHYCEECGIMEVHGAAEICYLCLEEAAEPVAIEDYALPVAA